VVPSEEVKISPHKFIICKNGDFSLSASDCEELVSSITGDDVIDIERNIFI